MANTNTSKIFQEQIEGNIVSSIGGPSVDVSDPKNPIIPEIPSVVDVENKANKDGSNTIGGIWQIDYILSEILQTNKNVIRVLINNSIEYGSTTLKTHLFSVDNINGLKINVNGNVGEIWHQFNFNPNDYAELEDVYTRYEIGDLSEVPNWSGELESATNF